VNQEKLCSAFDGLVHACTPKLNQLDCKTPSVSTLGFLFATAGCKWDWRGTVWRGIATQWTEGRCVMAASVLSHLIHAVRQSR